MNAAIDVSISRQQTQTLLQSWGHNPDFVTPQLWQMAETALTINRMRVGEIIVYLKIADQITVNNLLASKPVDLKALEYLATKIDGLRSRIEELLALQDQHPYYTILGTPHKDAALSDNVLHCNEIEAALIATPNGLPCLVFAEYQRLKQWKSKGRSERERDPIYRQYGDQIILAVAPRSQIIQRINVDITTNGGAIESQHKSPADAITDTQQIFVRVLDDAIGRNASNIAIQPDTTGTVSIRLRVNGEMQDSQIKSQITPTMAVEMANFLHQWADAQYTDSKTPVQGTLQGPAGGQFLYRTTEHDVNIRASFTLPDSLGTQKLECISLRLLQLHKLRVALRELHLATPVISAIEDTIHEQQGLLLVVGPTSSGKSTTIHGVLGLDYDIFGDTRNRLSVEDPVERLMPGLVSHSINRGSSYSQMLKEVLRQDPDTIFIGEMRDRDSTSIGIRAALTGHFTLSTLHANDALGAIGALRAYINNRTVSEASDVIVSEYDLIDALKLIIAQRLIPKLCPHCGTETINHHDAIMIAPRVMRYAERHGILGDTQEIRANRKNELAKVISRARVRNPNGCAHCNHTGLRGEIPINEFIECNHLFKQQLADQFAQGKYAVHELRHHVKNPIFDAAIACVAQGITPVASLYI